jgi:hypothetical protein
MSEIIIPGGSAAAADDDELSTSYQATDHDEEVFFCVLHLNMSVAEADAMDPERRKWFILRLMAQKNMEREALVQARMQQQLMAAGGLNPSLKQ